MKKILTTIFIMTAISTFYLLPAGGEAQIPSYQTLMDDLPGIGKEVKFDASSFSNFLNSAFKLGITVAIVLAIIMFVIGGIQYMGGDSVFNKEEAKGIFTNVVWGLVLALGIFLFLNTINPNLVKFNLKIEPPELSKTTVGGSAPATPAAPTVTADDQNKLNKILKDEQRVRKEISDTNVNIDINNGGLSRGWCVAVNQRSCTNVGLLPSLAIKGLDAFQKACGGIVVITGGTEFWRHKTHGPNIPIVDIRKTAEVEGCIKRISGFTTLNVGSTYTARFGGRGGNFYNEDNAHFHVTFF